MIIQSIQTGKVCVDGDANSRDPMLRQWTSGFNKQPTYGPIQATTTGLKGDEVADTRHHGGPDKAILCYAASHYELWAAQHSEIQWRGGAFGENLTIAESDEKNVCVGDVYEVGTAVIQVSQPRQPCWKISRRWQNKTLTKEVTQTGRTGWYLRVLTEGTISAGDHFKLIKRPQQDWTVAKANDVLYGRLVDRLAVIELMNLPELSQEWKQALA